MKHTYDTDVMIIGAGPTGLTVANVLARAGVTSQIVDRDTGPIRESRALIVHSRTQEIFDKLGLGKKLVSQGQRLFGAYVMVNGKKKGYLPAIGPEHHTPYSTGLILEQSKTQRILLDGLAEYDSKPEWSTELVDLVQNDTGVMALLYHADGQQRWVRSRYLIAADGARSHVRKAVDLHLEGSTYKPIFFLADVAIDWEFDHDKLYLNLTRDLMFGFFPLPEDKRYRVLGNLPEDMANQDQVSVQEVEALIHKGGIQAKLSDSRWITLYQLHKRMSSRFRIGNVFLAGDAAHIHSPAGGQGMNTGIGDGFNLAWKLAAVIQGSAHTKLLDSYEAERMPVARNVLNTSDNGSVAVMSENPLIKRAKLPIAAFIPTLLSILPPGKTFLFKQLAQLDVSYFESSVVKTEIAGKVLAGDRAPYGMLSNAQNTTTLDAIRGIDHQVMVFEGKTPRQDFDELCDRVRNVAVGYGFTKPLLTVHADNTDLHRVYDIRVSTLLLIRPDGYIGYRGKLDALGTFTTYLNTVYLSAATQRDTALNRRVVTAT